MGFFGTEKFGVASIGVFVLDSDCNQPVATFDPRDDPITQTEEVTSD